MRRARRRLGTVLIALIPTLVTNSTSWAGSSTTAGGSYALSADRSAQGY